MRQRVVVGGHAGDALEFVAEPSALRVEIRGLLPEHVFALVEVARAVADRLLAALHALGAALQRLLALLEPALDARGLLALLAQLLVDLLTVADGALLSVELDLAGAALRLLADQLGGLGRAAAHVAGAEAEHGVAEDRAQYERNHAHEGADRKLLHLGASIRDPRRRQSGSRV